MCRKRLLRLLPPWDPWESGAALDLVGAQKSSNLQTSRKITTRNDQFIIGKRNPWRVTVVLLPSLEPTHGTLGVNRKSIPWIPWSMFDAYESEV